jgi:hypothetical protein
MTLERGNGILVPFAAYRRRRSAPFAILLLSLKIVLSDAEHTKAALVFARFDIFQEGNIAARVCAKFHIFLFAK